MLPSYLSIGAAGILVNILAILSYIVIATAGITTTYYMVKFLHREWKAGKLYENRLLAAVAIMITGEVIAAIVHLISRTEYTLTTGSMLVPFTHVWVTWLYTLGHLVLALAMVNFMVVFYRDAGIKIFNWGNRRKKSGGNTFADADDSPERL